MQLVMLCTVFEFYTLITMTNLQFAQAQGRLYQRHIAYDANYRPLVVPEVITWSGNGSGTWFLLQNHPRSILDWRKILPLSCFDGVQSAEANGAGIAVPIIEHRCHRGSGTPESNPLGILEPLQCFWYPPTNREFGSPCKIP